jgi:hypothetical protein
VMLRKEVDGTNKTGIMRLKKRNCDVKKTG